MREIKFRAWDTEENKWVRPPINETFSVNQEDAFLKDGENPRLPLLWGIMESDRYKFMQYTGLTDKNGNPIYEGDILENEWDKRKFVCEFKNGSFIALQNTNEKVEVIGNIYENPELIKDYASSRENRAE